MKWIARQRVLIFLMALIAAGVKAELVVVVHPDNPLETLTQAQLKRIFLGRMPMFPNTKDRIIALDLPSSDPGFDEFYQNVVELENLELTRYRAYYLFSGRGKLPKEMESAKAVVDEIVNNRKAIGYIERGDLSDKVRVILTVAD